MRTKRKLMEIDEKLIGLAIEELVENNIKVNLKNVVNASGYTEYQVKNCEAMSAYYNPKKRGAYKRKSLNGSRVFAPLPKIHVETIKDEIAPDVEIYTNYIKQNYFAHAECLDDVEFDMSDSIKNFNVRTFNLSINKLKLEHNLRDSPFRKGFMSFNVSPILDTPKTEQANDSIPDLIGDIIAITKDIYNPDTFNAMPISTPEPTPTPLDYSDTYLIVSDETNENFNVIGKIALENKINWILEHQDIPLKIYKLVEVAEVKKVITRKKI